MEELDTIFSSAKLVCSQGVTLRSMLTLLDANQVGQIVCGINFSSMQSPIHEGGFP